MNLFILEKRIIGVYILWGFFLMENWIEGCGWCCVIVVGNMWLERGIICVLIIDIIKIEFKILIWKYNRVFKCILINLIIVMGFVGIIFFLI